MFIKKAYYKPENQYEVYYDMSETGERTFTPVACFNSLQDATLFMRYVQGKDMENDQIRELEIAICHIDFVEKQKREAKEREKAEAKAKREARKAGKK